MTKEIKILISTGGTGGHIFPALAFIEDLDKSKYKYLLLADSRFLNFQSQIKDSIRYQIILSSPLASGGIFKKLFGILKILIGIIQTIYVIFVTKPVMTISFGGYPSFPIMCASKLCGVPIIIHEPNALVGLSSKYFARSALAISVAFKNTKGLENVDQSKIYYTGTPKRQSILMARKYKYDQYKKGEEFNILVLGGSQGARIFSDVIPRAMALLDDKTRKRISLQQQCRPECIDDLRLAYESIGVSAYIKRFFDDMGKAFKKAHLVIARAGALTVSELITVGRPAILVPFANAADNHQLFNAKELEKEKAAWVLTEAEFYPENLAQMLTDLIAHPTILRSYAANARKLFKESNDSFYKMFESCVQSIIRE